MTAIEAARLSAERAWNEMDLARDVAEKERDQDSRLEYEKRYREYQVAAAAYDEARKGATKP